LAPAGFGGGPVLRKVVEQRREQVGRVAAQPVRHRIRAAQCVPVDVELNVVLGQPQRVVPRLVRPEVRADAEEQVGVGEQRLSGGGGREVADDQFVVLGDRAAARVRGEDRRAEAFRQRAQRAAGRAGAAAGPDQRAAISATRAVLTVCAASGRGTAGPFSAPARVAWCAVHWWSIGNSTLAGPYGGVRACRSAVRRTLAAVLADVVVAACLDTAVSMP